MAKRFCDTEIWKKQRWFRKLSPDHKLAFLYIINLCNHGGIWNINCPDLIDDIGFTNEFNLAEFIECCNTDYDKITGQKIQRQRLMYIKDEEVIYLTKYIQFQYEGKERTVNPHGKYARSGLEILATYGLLGHSLANGFITLSIPILPLSIGYPYPIDRAKEKDKELIGSIYTSGVGDKEEGEGGGKGGNGKQRNGFHPPPVLTVGGKACKPKKMGQKYVYTEIRGTEFDSLFSKVLLADDSWQLLDNEQQTLAGSQKLKPQDVFKIVAVN